MKSSRISRLRDTEIYWFVDKNPISIKGLSKIYHADGIDIKRMVRYTAIYDENLGIEGIKKDKYEHKLPRRRSAILIKEETRFKCGRKNHPRVKKISWTKRNSSQRGCRNPHKRENRFLNKILWV